MAYTLRQLPDVIVYGLVLAWNQWRGGTAQVGALFHADVTSTGGGDGYFFPTASALQVTATASDLPSSILLANSIQGVCTLMMKDAISTNKYSAGAHKVPDTANATQSPLAVDLPSTIVLANAWKTQLNAHFTQAGVHFNNDGTNTVVAATATDLPSSITLLNAIKASVNAHISSAPVASSMINIIAP